MRHANRRRRQSGFSLLEVLVALVILSVGLASLIPVLIHVVKGNSFGKAALITATWSQDKLEELRVVPFDDLCASLPCDETDHPSSPPLTLTREWKIVDACGGCGDIVEIEVCTAETVDQQGVAFGAKCFPTSSAPEASRHFLAVRARF